MVRIVLVDDHEDSLEALAEGLRLCGYEVYTASNGRSGLEQAERHSADAMIIDLVMPDMNGFEVARAARQKLGGQVTLIALSGYGERSNRQRSIEAGFNYQLLKPVTPENLIPYLGSAA